MNTLSAFLLGVFGGLSLGIFVFIMLLKKLIKISKSIGE